jgi:hypothetical protein
LSQSSILLYVSSLSAWNLGPFHPAADTHLEGFGEGVDGLVGLEVGEDEDLSAVVRAGDFRVVILRGDGGAVGLPLQKHIHSLPGDCSGGVHGDGYGITVQLALFNMDFMIIEIIWS